MKDQIEKQAIEEMARKTCRNYMPNGNCAADDEPCSLECVYGYFAERLYSAGYRKQEWISVENPPETYRDEYDELIPFLVCCKGTVYPFRAVYDGTNWGDGIGKLKVTHWMPLPEPPKMKGD